MNVTTSYYESLPTGWCTCSGPFGIGLPFDHPIWAAIVRECPVHGTAYASSGHPSATYEVIVSDGTDYQWSNNLAISVTPKRGRHERQD